MKMRMVALLSAALLFLTLVVGCAPTGPSAPNKDTTAAPQAVIALNPIFAYDDGTTVVGYNDIQSATRTDYNNAAFAALHQDTAWGWMYKIPDNWKKRAVHTMGRWQNGAGAMAKGMYAYAFNDAGTTSLSSYHTKVNELAAYDADALPEYGLVMSVSGGEEEALTYTVQKDGMLNVVAGNVAAVEAVTGVNTGFLAEDGTPRRASVRLMVNNVQVWSGTLCNSTAAEDGVAVTSLSYGQISDLPVEAGDTILLAVKLDAAANTQDDQSAPPVNEEDNWTLVGTEVKVPVTNKNEGAGNTDATANDALSILHEYLFRFTIVRDETRLDEDMNAAVIDFRSNLEFILDTEVLLRGAQHTEQTYELVIGPMDSRPESSKVYGDLLDYRPNNANDFIIRRVGTKVYVAASNVRSLESAFDHFIKTFCATEDEAVPVGYNYAYQAPVSAASIAGVNVGNYVIRVEKYPSTIVYLAAQGLQTWVKENCGYLLPIRPMTDDGKHYTYELCIGPMNGSVKVERAYDTRFTSDTVTTVGQYRVDPNGYLTGTDAGYYTVALSGKTLSVQGGSPYAVNAAVTRICADLAKDKSLPAGYAFTGTYRTGGYTLFDGYDLVWQEDFSYDTQRPATEISREVGEYWSISRDTTSGPTRLGVDAAGNVIWDEQRRPGVYGENWWIYNDPATGNGYLLEVTKKEEYGYDAVRLISQNKWAFRYGVWETRLVIGSRNGACSAVWALGGAPDQTTVYNEIDIYENFGRDMVKGAYHTWQPDSMGGVISHVERGDMKSVELTPAKGEHFYDTFHSIAVEWTPTRIDYYWDGQLFNYMDVTNRASGQAPTTIKFANGVGTTYYCDGNDPVDWMNEAYTAATGKTVEDFFELQTVDYSYILQTSNEGKSKTQQSTFKFARSHPGNIYYNGYLSKNDGFVNAQKPR